ncbi:MAG: methyltransferase domain-containing protein [Patescibacteria group bacterium]|nr:methyltransferase domain-containing protein [Patescibacteria group bacterium]
MIKKNSVPLKLNLGCGRNVKKGWVNVDKEEREKKLDLICDLAKKFPFKDNSCGYIYCEHFIEHLDWLAGRRFLENCYRCLGPRGILRLVFPDFKKIFQAYLKRDFKFFEPAARCLNEADYKYYQSVYNDPEKIRRERKDNPPPAWHLSRKKEDRDRLERRARKFKYLIDYVDWYAHQFGEHQCLYDGESIVGILKEIGFSKVKIVKHKPQLDSGEGNGRVSCFIEAVKSA